MKYTRCEQKRHECFACDKHGCCVALGNTTFRDGEGKEYPCPFYKTQAQAGTNAEVIKYKYGDFGQ